jgi:16S rRNA (cytosine1402-N4)-methyltransferase
MQHVPVLFQEVIDILNPVPGGQYVDGTVGAGGHSRGILESSSPDGQLIGIDRDPAALALAEENLAGFSGRFSLIQGSYHEIESHLNNRNWHSVDGILIDLGLSSMQLDSPERGFSFRFEGPLDMRFDPRQPLTASDLVNGSSREDLAEMIFKYGEEKFSRKIADAIIKNRPFETTKELADLIQEVVPHRNSRIHPATRTFQALRIIVNNELDILKTFLPEALGLLKTGGRLAVIAFHSLEDRIVKEYFRQESRDCICPPEIPMCVCEHQKQLIELTRRPVRPEEKEMTDNPRARSAKLRAAEKIF